MRKILPKGSPFDAILDEEMRRIDRMLNDRPLKRLDWRTPSRAGLAFGANYPRLFNLHNKLFLQINGWFRFLNQNML